MPWRIASVIGSGSSKPNRCQNRSSSCSVPVHAHQRNIVAVHDPHGPGTGAGGLDALEEHRLHHVLHGRGPTERCRRLLQDLGSPRFLHRFRARLLLLGEHLRGIDRQGRTSSDLLSERQVFVAPYRSCALGADHRDRADRPPSSLQRNDHRASQAKVRASSRADRRSSINASSMSSVIVSVSSATPDLITLRRSGWRVQIRRETTLQLACQLDLPRIRMHHDRVPDLIALPAGRPRTSRPVPERALHRVAEAPT